MTELCVVISYPPDSLNGPYEALRKIRKFVEITGECDLPEDAPLAWNLPSGLIGAASGPARELRKSLGARGGNIILPMGFSGAHPDLLRDSEVKSEIQWASTNQWKTGFKDSGVRLPITPGATRPGVLGRGLLFTDGRERRVIPAMSAADLDTRSPRSIDRSMVRKARSLKRSQSGTGDFESVVLLIPIPETRIETFEVILQSLAAATTVGKLRLAAPVPPDRWPAAHGLPKTVPAPELSTALNVAAWRGGRNTLERRKTILQTLAWGGSTETPPRGEGSSNGPSDTRVPFPRAFDASMMGDVTLAGPGYAARFSKGQFAGFDTGDDRGNQFPVATTRATVTAGGGARFDLPLDPTTCFSFEAAKARGVRVVHRAQCSGPNLRIVVVTDFSFVADYPVLVCTAAVGLEGGPFTGPMQVVIQHQGVVCQPDDLIRCGVSGQDGERSSDRACGSWVRVTRGDTTVSSSFLSRSASPVILGARATDDSGLRAIPGGQFSLTELPGAAEYAFFLEPGHREATKKLLSGRLPADVRRELGSGPSRADVNRILHLDEGPQEQRP